MKRNSPSATPIASHQLVDTWKLKSLCHRLENGRVRHPYGKKVSGVLIYSADGGMCVIIQYAGLKKFAKTGLWEASAAEKIRAFDNCVAYAGRYRLRGNLVTHKVSNSLFPNWKGTTLTRRVELCGRLLKLTTVPFVANGQKQVAELVWRRQTAAL